MERSAMPKLKKAVITLKKLDMLTENPFSESVKSIKKEPVEVSEDSGDHSSESIAASAESNTICTDDDDLEKKIQAFSIPVKIKEEKQSSTNENNSDKSDVIGKVKAFSIPVKIKDEKLSSTNENNSIKSDSNKSDVIGKVKDSTKLRKRIRGEQSNKKEGNATSENENCSVKNDIEKSVAGKGKESTKAMKRGKYTLTNKNEEEPNSKNENENIKNDSHQSIEVGKGNENPKLKKRVRTEPNNKKHKKPCSLSENDSVISDSDKSVVIEKGNESTKPSKRGKTEVANKHENRSTSRNKNNIFKSDNGKCVVVGKGHENTKAVKRRMPEPLNKKEQEKRSSKHGNNNVESENEKCVVIGKGNENTKAIKKGRSEPANKKDEEKLSSASENNNVGSDGVGSVMVEKGQGSKSMKRGRYAVTSKEQQQSSSTNENSNVKNDCDVSATITKENGSTKEIKRGRNVRANKKEERESSLTNENDFGKSSESIGKRNESTKPLKRGRNALVNRQKEEEKSCSIKESDNAKPDNDQSAMIGKGNKSTKAIKRGRYGPDNKREEKSTSTNENKSVRSVDNQSVVIGKENGFNKVTKEVSSVPSNDDIGVEEKDALKVVIESPTEVALPEKQGTRKSNPVKKIKKMYKKEGSSYENKAAVKHQNINDANKSAPINLNTSCYKSVLQHNLGEKENEKNGDFLESQSKNENSSEQKITGQEAWRKRKIREENVKVPRKNSTIMKKISKSSTYQTPADQIKKNTQKRNEVSMKLVAARKSTSRSSLKINFNSNQEDVKRSARISNAANALKTAERKRRISKSFGNQNLERKIASRKHSDAQLKTVKKNVSNDKNSSLTLEAHVSSVKVKRKVAKKIMEETLENRVVEKRSSLDDLILKEEYPKTLMKVTGFGKEHQKHSIASGKENKAKVKDTKLQTSDMFDEGEELLEKICDILEDSSGAPEFGCSEKKVNVSHLLYPASQKIVASSKERVMIPNPSDRKPVVHRNARFPSHCKGSVSYKKIWKWSHYVKMPSDMWSIFKHPDGNFVVVFHISELSPFPKLIIDKCIIFKETASPWVKIYGKDVVALSSREELQTLGNVCSFLKHIHDLSLCEGKQISLEAESNENCELYAEGKVPLPFKCKFCL